MNVYTKMKGHRRRREMRRAGGPIAFALDLDGCLTDGRFAIDAKGVKRFKMFGPDDHDALSELVHHIPVLIVTSDQRGWNINQARAQQMNIPIVYAPSKPHERVNAIANGLTTQYGDINNQLFIDTSRIVYMGDGYHDAHVFDHLGFGISPRDAWPHTRRIADAVTTRSGGNRSVAQAAHYIIQHFT